MGTIAAPASGATRGSQRSTTPSPPPPTTRAGPPTSWRWPQYGMAGKRVLDVACGTGKSFMPFLRRGFGVTGCDVSPAMLAEARARPRTSRWSRPTCARCPIGHFELVTCFDDSLNHLLDEGELASALASLAQNLRRRAPAVRPQHPARLPDDVRQDSVLSTTAHVRAGAGTQPDAPPGCCAAARIDVFAKSADGCYERTSRA